MALQDYTQMHSDITDVLREYGTQFKLSRPVNNNGLVTDKTVAAIVYGTMDAQLANYFSTTNGGIIATDHKTVYLTTFGNGKTDPEPGDRLISGKNSWRIAGVEVFRPDGITTIAYTLDVT